MARRHPREVAQASATRRPASAVGVAPTPIGQGTPVTLRRDRSVRGAGRTPTSCAASPRARCPPIAYARLGDITTAQFQGARLDPAGARRRGPDHQPPEPRLPRPLRSASCHSSTSASSAIGMAEPGAELSRDVVACPGADTCNLAVTQSRGLADAIGARPSTTTGLAEVGGIRIEHLRLHELVRPAPHLRHRLLRRRTPGPRQVGARLPDAARRLRRTGEDRLRREGPAPPRQERSRGRGAGRPPLPRRARGRRVVPIVDRPLGRRGHDRRRR